MYCIDSQQQNTTSDVTEEHESSDSSTTSSNETDPTENSLSTTTLARPDPVTMPPTSTTVSHNQVPQHDQPTSSKKPKEDFKEIQELIAKSNWKEAKEKLKQFTKTTMMYITDAGGQPEFFDIIPLLFNGPTFSIIFLSLDQPLTSHFNIAYRHEHKSTIFGRRPKSIEYLSSYTPLDMLQQVLASVESLNNSPTQQSGAFIIATHLDKIED